MASSILTMRGEFFVGNLEPFDPNADGSVIANAMTSLGIVSKCTLEPASDRVKVTEWKTGNDSVAESWTRNSGGKIKLLAEESNAFNLALNLAGRVRNIAPESATGAKLAIRTSGKYAEQVAGDTLTATTAYRFVKTISTDGLTYDPWDTIDTATFVLTDSTPTTPVTLTLTTDYTINGVTGDLKLTAAGATKANANGPLVASFDTGTFIDTLPKPLAKDLPYMLSFKNISNVVVKNNAGTVIAATTYAVDTDYGTITFNTLPAANLQPLKVYAKRGTVKSVSILSEPQITKQIRLNGINVRTQQKMSMTLYKVSFDTAAVDFFDKDYAKTPLEGEIMADPSRPIDATMGQFGVIEYL